MATINTSPWAFQRQFPHELNYAINLFNAMISFLLYLSKPNYSGLGHLQLTKEISCSTDVITNTCTQNIQKC